MSKNAPGSSVERYQLQELAGCFLGLPRGADYMDFGTFWYWGATRDGSCPASLFGFWTSGIPKVPLVGIQKWSNDLDDLRGPHDFGNLHLSCGWISPKCIFMPGGSATYSLLCGFCHCRWLIIQINPTRPPKTFVDGSVETAGFPEGKVFTTLTRLQAIYI